MNQSRVSASSSIDDADSVWTVVEAKLDRFCGEWENAPPIPQLHPLVDDLPAGSGVRRLVLIDLIKVDLEYRWKVTEWARCMDDYLAEWPELTWDGSVPAELLYEEIYQRKQNGQSIQLNEYLHKYPDAAEALQRLV